MTEIDQNPDGFDVPGRTSGSCQGRSRMLSKREHRLGFIPSQSEIKDVKALPHVSAVCCASERQHPELDSETKYYLWNRLVMVTGDLSHA